MATGEPSARVFDEATPIAPLPERAGRVAIDKLVQTASGIRSVVLCNSMIYGNALGPPAQSVQLPTLVRQARASGVACYIGRGLNRVVQRPHRSEIIVGSASSRCLQRPGFNQCQGV
jgi:hypothetical protein